MSDVHTAAVSEPEVPSGRRDPYREPTLSRHLAYNVLVGDVMRRRPVTIEPGATLWDALVEMRTHEITGMPVVAEGGRLVGVLSQKDVAAFLAIDVGLPEPVTTLDLLTLRHPGGGEAPTVERFREVLERATVAEAMSQPPIFIRSDDSLELAMERMAERGVNRLPVVDGHRLVGIVTPTDLFRAALRAGRRPA